MAYVDGFVIPVLPGKEEAYAKMAADAAPFFMKHGALQVVECMEDDIKDGQVTDLRRAVAAQPGEKIVFAWIVWPSKAVRDAAEKAMMEDPEMKAPDEMPFDGKRLIVGGFRLIMAAGEPAAFQASEAEPA